ncbi:MAG: hypothetical protein WDN45_08645 [Caulobacteraceae bacterium]
MTDNTPAAEAAARQQRGIQRQVEEADKRPAEEASFAMQAGARRYPEPPFPAQHQAKPGSQADLELQPLYDAPYYEARAS